MKHKLVIIRLIIVGLLLNLSGCFIGAGTLGGFDTISFPTSKRVLVTAIDSLFKEYPAYKIPEKWKPEDNWKERGFDFLDTRIFYFKSTPEEMYYVSFYGDANQEIQVDTTQTRISIRAVDNTTTYTWTKEEDIRSSEKKRITKRFNDEIISKLELYTNTKSVTGH